MYYYLADYAGRGGLNAEYCLESMNREIFADATLSDAIFIRSEMIYKNAIALYGGLSYVIIGGICNINGNTATVDPGWTIAT